PAGGQRRIAGSEVPDGGGRPQQPQSEVLHQVRPGESVAETKDVMLRRNQKSRVAVAVIAIVLVAFAGRLPGPALHGGEWHSPSRAGRFLRRLHGPAVRPLAVQLAGRLARHHRRGGRGSEQPLLALAPLGPRVAAPSPHQPSAAPRAASPGEGAPLVRSMGSVGHHFRAAHPVFRIVITVIAGTMGVPYRIFVPSVVVSTAIWAAVGMWLGATLGETLGNILFNRSALYL